MKLMELEGRLDKKHPNWNVYISSQRKWVLTIKSQKNQIKQFCGINLIGMMERACEYEFIQVAPKKPDLILSELFEVKKGKSVWHVWYKGYQNFTTQTKKEAIQIIEKTIERNKFKIKKWEEKWGSLQHGTDYIHNDQL